MENQCIYKLIDGEFDAQQARLIVSSLYASKINFHSREALSNNERFGEDKEHSEIRIRELKETQQKIGEVLNEAIISNCRVKIYGSITLEILG